jgi:hypothetical protein
MTINISGHAQTISVFDVLRPGDFEAQNLWILGLSKSVPRVIWTLLKYCFFVPIEGVSTFGEPEMYKTGVFCKGLFWGLKFGVENIILDLASAGIVMDD